MHFPYTFKPSVHGTGKTSCTNVNIGVFCTKERCAFRILDASLA